MNELTPLIRPAQSQVKIDYVAKECPSEGFNYPTFRQLNKHARVYLSQPLELNPSTSYNLFDVANTKGWFVAVKQASTGTALILSTLEDLRTSFSSAKDSPDDLFTPKRTVPTSSRVNIVRFACGDSRLLVAQDNGSILVFDTSQLFVEGTNEVHPLTSSHIQTTYLHQIVPNPGTEPGLSDLVAVVANSKVQLFNLDLEPQGGWAGSDLMTQPITVAWSPKGKHIAIGLQTGDILTYSLTNKSTPHKHIPPTVDGILASLNWLGPGHTFRTSYASQADSSPQQHIIVLDAKSSTATYFSPDHPFPCNDRNYQNGYVLTFPKWDTDSASNDESKSLTVVGDASSIDLEVLGNFGNSWHRQSQDNPLSLPLDSAMEDTILVAFESDLTDSAASAPIMYAYLNDGSLQGWHLEHTKPYLGIVTPNASGAPSVTTQTSIPAQDSGKDTDMGAEETSTASPFGQSSTVTNAFSQTSFNQQASSAFGSNSTSAFGQTGFGQKLPAAASAFGQSTFGQPSAFGSATGFSSVSPFSQPGQSSTAASPFGSAKPASAFGAFAGSNNAFGNAGSSPFGSNSSTAFGGLSSGTSNAFGQGSFGSSTQSTTQTTSESSNMTREASMSDSTPGFGSLGLGSATPSDPNARNSMFGSFSNSDANTNSQSSGFGNGPLVKPATGFGAFGDSKPSSTFEAPKPSSTTSAFSVPSQPSTGSGFGQSGFANPAFGKPAFGQPAFGQPAFGKPSLGATSSTSAPTSGGFGAFANTPVTFGNAAQQQKPTSTTPSTFGASSTFASSGPSTFGTALASTDAKPASQGGFSSYTSNTSLPFASTPSTNENKPDSTPGGAFSAFSSTAPLAFGSATANSETTAKETAKTPSPFGASAASSPSPFAAPSTPVKDAAPRTSAFGATQGAFGGASSALGQSPFATPSRPSPFGHNDNDSPEQPSPPSSPEPVNSPPAAFAAASTTPSSTSNAFSNLQTTPSSFKPATGFGAFGGLGGSSTSPFFKKPDETLPPVSAFALGSSPKTPTNVTTAPAFGSTSTLGGPKSVFAPVTPPTTTPSKPPTSGGFSAFSGASSNFSSYVGNKTSFSDLLKTGGEEVKDPVKSHAGPSTSKSDEGSAQTSVFSAPNVPPKKEAPVPPVSVFAPIPKADERQTKRPVSDEPSYGSISASSASSSFVDVSTEMARDGERSEEEADAEHSGEEDVNSFLSDDYNGEGSEEPSSEGSDRDDLPEEERSSSPETPARPSSGSRSLSATPQPETPSIRVSLPPDDDAEEQAFAEKEASTTPPGTPESASTSAPPPTTPAAPSSLSNFGNVLGLGRASTRPTRSSPLSNTISHEEEEKEEEIAKPIRLIPVSPKSPVAILPVKLDDEPSIKRSKTPPLLSTLSGGQSPTPHPPSLPVVSTPPFKSPFSVGSSTQAESSGSGALGTLAAAASSAPSLFGKPTEKVPPSQPGVARPATAPPNLFATPPPFSTQAPSFGKQPFGLQNVSTAPAQTSAPGIKSPTVPVMPAQGMFGGPAPATPAQQPFSLFGASQKTAMKTPAPPTFGSPVAGMPPPRSSLPFSLAPSNLTAPKNALTPPFAPPMQSEEAKLEEGMQKECIMILRGVQADLGQTSKLGSFVHNIFTENSFSKGGSRLKAGLSDTEKWGLADIEQFARVLLQFQDDLDTLETNQEKDQQMLREIQSNMLKAGTRREEIARFNKAKNDKEFAKMLRSRTLGPEHSETQMHLRKSIRAIRDRIQKLEMHLQEDKKKLARSTSFKPSFRAPSLDTINRTYRNIEIAIDQQSDEVARLASRISKLDIEEKGNTPVGRDRRLPDAEHLRSFTVTPNVAATTAAALNAERSARRLKNALLRVRSEPLLNDKATSAPSAPNDFSAAKSPFGDALFGEFPTLADVPTVNDIPAWDIPPDNFSPTGNSVLSMGFRPSAKPKKHQAFQRKASATTPSPSASPFTPSGFEWGPLPNFSKK